MPHRFTLVTPAGKTEDPSDAEVERAVDATQAVDGAFLVLERDDGAFLQFDGTMIEWNPGKRHQRFDLGPRAKDAFTRFGRGEDVSMIMPWRDVGHLLAQEASNRKATRRNTMLLLLFLAVVAAVGLRFLRGL